MRAYPFTAPLGCVSVTSLVPVPDCESEPLCALESPDDANVRLNAPLPVKVRPLNVATPLVTVAVALVSVPVPGARVAVTVPL